MNFTMESIMLHHLFGQGKLRRPMSQQEVYQKYLELSTQRQEATGGSRLGIDIVLDTLWERMDGMAKRHRLG